MLTDYRLFINGQWRDGSAGERFPAVNPYDQTVWASVAQATEADVAEAIAMARHAFEKVWRHTNGLERARCMNRLADILEKNADRLCVMESTDNGKVVRETRPQMTF